MSDFRKRVLTPLLIPLSAFVFVGGVAWGLSRILLVTTKDGAAGVALFAAVIVLAVCGAVASRGFHMTEKAISLFSFVALVAGGSVFAATMGIRPIEKHLPEPSAEVVAKNAVRFEQATLTVEPEDTIVIRFENEDPAAVHNWGLQKEAKFAAGPAIVDPQSPIAAGESRDYILDGLAEGAYHYFCFVHPNMTGTLIVGAGGAEAPPPGPPAGPAPSTPAVPTGVPGELPSGSPSPSQPAAPSSTVEITAEGIAFDTDSLTLTAGKKIDVTFHNQDASVPHNFAIYTVDLGTKIFDTGTFPGVETKTGSFPAPDPGEYVFRCDVHPQQMNGTVKFV